MHLHSVNLILNIHKKHSKIIIPPQNLFKIISTTIFSERSTFSDMCSDYIIRKEKQSLRELLILKSAKYISSEFIFLHSFPVVHLIATCTSNNK